MKGKIPSWRINLNSAIEEEGLNKGTFWIQLATTAANNSPRVRTVVFRGWNDEGEMEILSDNRSQKFQELKINPNVEICWLLTKARCQFRFRGLASVSHGEKANKYWLKLTTKERALWSWPYPSKQYIKSQVFGDKIQKEGKMIKNFSLLRIKITYVEQLNIEEFPHKRVFWSMENEWQEKRINP